jgi:hypothetical protein
MQLPSRRTLRWLAPVLLVLTLGTAVVSWVLAQSEAARFRALARGQVA